MSQRQREVEGRGDGQRKWRRESEGGRELEWMMERRRIRRGVR